MRKMHNDYFVIIALALMLFMSMLVMSGTAFAERCVDKGDGTVTDNDTGLMWQKATAGPMNWDAAMSYASGLYLGGHSDWGLPNQYELENLYHSPCKSIVEVVWSNYWSSTTYADDTSSAWLVNFDYGYVYADDNSYSYYVRAVRSGR